ncbi:hypothetical protein RCL_jg23121.t1 [Rhizophagus clarus]|uniref:Uncharacterized protein n=1 Tax=Rhizophagus clarus TaxID=94130 RepID=A0A8H3L2A8_9GLOM|nr:hypothetical protein RCL_jg23121.t1 [Rhizophagus clarus]
MRNLSIIVFTVLSFISILQLQCILIYGIHVSSKVYYGDRLCVRDSEKRRKTLTGNGPWRGKWSVFSKTGFQCFLNFLSLGLSLTRSKIIFKIKLRRPANFATCF